MVGNLAVRTLKIDIPSCSAKIDVRLLKKRRIHNAQSSEYTKN